MSFQKILVGLALTPTNQSVFEEALELAIANHGQLFLFHSISAESTIAPPPFSGELGLSPHLIEQSYQVEKIQIEHQTRYTKEYLADLCKKAACQGVYAESAYQLDEPGRSLCRKAEDWDADVIVVGRRGRSGLTEVLLGSVSNYVLHHSPCTVMVVQGQKKSQEPAEVASARSS
ncbi:MAG: universal stress protein [Elainellaceae cyanobacterium]